MIKRRRFERFYLLVGACFVVAAAYFVTVTVPLAQRERELDDQVGSAADRLAAAGHGMSVEEIRANVEFLRAEIDSYAAISGDPARAIQFDPEVLATLDQPFQLIEYDAKKFRVLDGLRARSAEKKVGLFDGWRDAFPAYSGQAPARLWAELTVMDQVFRTAIHAGVASIDSASVVHPGPDGLASGREVAVRIQLTGPMEAIHSVLMILPLNREEMTAMEIDGPEGTKSALFLSRFILKKSSAENANEVTIDFVASGFLDVET